MTEPLMQRAEVEALLFDVADIAQVMRDVHALLFPEDEDGEEEADEG